MRDSSIISIIRRYGLHSKRLDPRCRIRYQESLDDLSAFSSGSLKLMNVIDNVRDPHSSISGKCMVPGCGKPIRYENHLMDVSTGKIVACGSGCCCRLLGLSKLRAKNFRNIETALKEKAELEEWKKENPRTVEKLKKLAEYDLPFYRPFIGEMETCALTAEDTRFINGVSLRLVLGDLKYLDVISDLLEHENDEDAVRILKSIRDHCLVQGKHFSRKQKEFLAGKYTEMLRKSRYVTVEISHGYDCREFLKKEGYAYCRKDRTWQKTVRKNGLDRELDTLRAAGVPEGSITCK